MLVAGRLLCLGQLLIKFGDFSCVSIEVITVKLLPRPVHTAPPQTSVASQSAHTTFLSISSPPQTRRIISRSGNGIFTGFKEKLRVLSNLRSTEATFQTAGIVVTAGAG